MSEHENVVKVSDILKGNSHIGSAIVSGSRCFPSNSTRSKYTELGLSVPIPAPEYNELINFMNPEFSDLKIERKGNTDFSLITCNIDGAPYRLLVNLGSQPLEMRCSSKLPDKYRLLPFIAKRKESNPEFWNAFQTMIDQTSGTDEKSKIKAAGVACDSFSLDEMFDSESSCDFIGDTLSKYEIERILKNEQTMTEVASDVLKSTSSFGEFDIDTPFSVEAAKAGVYRDILNLPEEAKQYIPDSRCIDDFVWTKEAVLVARIVQDQLLNCRRAQDDGVIDFTEYTVDDIYSSDKDLDSEVRLKHRDNLITLKNDYGLIPSNILLYGPAGTGKSSIPEVIAASFGIPLLNITGSQNTEEGEFQGDLTMGEKGLVFSAKNFVTAARLGGIVLIDEPNLVQPGVLMGSLSSFTDHRGFLNTTNGKTVYRNPANIVFFAMNKGYTGTQPLNEAMENRFMSLKCDRLPRHVAVKALLNKFNNDRFSLDEKTAGLIYDTNEKLRQAIETKDALYADSKFTMRTMQDVARFVANPLLRCGYKSMHDVYNVTVLDEIVYDHPNYSTLLSGALSTVDDVKFDNSDDFDF